MIYKVLQPAINLGLDEEQFWLMTFAEIDRWVKGANWRMQMKAQYDYNLANLIGLSNARLLSKDAKYPELEEAYPYLFEDMVKEKQQKEEEARMLKSQNNFMKFAMAFNAKKRKGVET